MNQPNLPFAKLLCVAILGLGGTAFAGNTYSATDSTLQHVTPGTPADGTLDLTTDGFVPPGSLTSFSVTFDFDRPNSSGNSTDPIVDITLGGITVLTGGTVPDMGTMSYTITDPPTGGSTLLADLNSSGTLSYEVTTGTGDYYLEEVSLSATDPGTTSVPDAGSTMTLLGFSLLGVSAAARRFRLTR